MSTQDHLGLDKKAEEESKNEKEDTGVGAVGRNVSKVVDPVGDTVETILSPVGTAVNGILRPITDSVGSLIKPMTVHPDESEIKKKEKVRLEKEREPIGGKRQDGNNPLGLNQN